MAGTLPQLSALGLSLILSACAPLLTPLEQSPATQAPTPPAQEFFEFAYTQPPHQQAAEPYMQSMRELRVAIKGMAGLRAELAGEGAGLQLRDARLAEVAVLILSGPPQEEEWSAFAHYLREGGFFIGTRSQAAGVRSALAVHDGPAAADGTFYTVPLTDDHPLFAGLQSMGAAPSAEQAHHRPSLAGFFLRGRLVGVLADDSPVAGLIGSASNFDSLADKTRLTIGIMIYALQQEGSTSWKQQHPAGTGQTAPASAAP